MDAMLIYVIYVAIASLLAGIIIPLRTKKAEGVVYEKLDKTTKVTNILLSIVYLCLSPLYMFIGWISRPHYEEGFLWLLGWIVAIIIASALLFCGVGIGLSIAYRKQGKSKKSFIVQFAGLAAMIFAFVLFLCTYGNLLNPLN